VVVAVLGYHSSDISEFFEITGNNEGLPLSVVNPSKAGVPLPTVRTLMFPAALKAVNEG